MEEPPIQFRVLGCSGGREPGANLTSFLINEKLLVDAGNAAASLSVKEQVQLSAILITHTHLDHIGDIPFIADNIFGARSCSLPIISFKSVLEDLHKYLFNNIIWPDFTVLSAGNHPILEFDSISEGEERSIEGVRIKAYPVNHNVNAVGYIFQDEGGAVVYSGDTGPTEKIWEKAKKLSDVRAIIVELSFPNRLHEVANAAKHFTPAMLKEEMKKMPPKVPLYCFHIKPLFSAEIQKEIEALGESRIHILAQGKTYTF